LFFDLQGHKGVQEPEQHAFAQISLLLASNKASVSTPVNHHMGTSFIYTSQAHCKQRNTETLQAELTRPFIFSSNLFNVFATQSFVA
jgi:hypothetical protein